MRRKIVAGNWKMNTTPAEGVALLEGVAALKGGAPADVELIVGVPFTHLCSVKGPAEKAGIVRITNRGLIPARCRLR